MEEEPATPTDARFARDAQIQSEVPESMAPLGEDAGIGPLLQRFSVITATFIPERIADFKAENARIAWSQHMEGAGLMIEVDTGGVLEGVGGTDAGLGRRRGFALCGDRGREEAEQSELEGARHGGVLRDGSGRGQPGWRAVCNAPE